jgi:hypothetical protein
VPFQPGIELGLAPQDSSRELVGQPAIGSFQPLHAQLQRRIQWKTTCCPLQDSERSASRREAWW